MYVLTNTERQFIPTSQKEEEKPLTFRVIPPSRKTTLDLQELILKSVNAGEELETLDLPLSLMMDLYLEACVIGWENMNDAEGTPIEFTKEDFEGFNSMEILLELYTFVKELAESTPKN